MNIDFNKGDGLVPVIIQDNNSLQVLMLGYMNQEAFALTQNTLRVTFFSRSKNRLWVKGETSGNFLNVVDIVTDCDSDALVVFVNPEGPTCHKGTVSCFSELKTRKQNQNGFLYALENIIDGRVTMKDPNSYTSELFKKGINKVAQKVGEEAVELIIEAKDSNGTLFKGEAADLMFHYLLLLRKKGFGLKDIEDVLRDRHQMKTT